MDPPQERRLDNAAWQIARAARTKATIYQTEFDGREKPPAPSQSPEEMAATAKAIEKTWPNKQRN